MRIVIDITGRVQNGSENDNIAFSNETFIQEIPGTMEDAKSRLFATSLANTFVKGVQSIKENSDEKKLLSEKDVKYLTSQQEKGNKAHIYADVWMERRKGKPTYFCKVYNDAGKAGVRTLNILATLTRMLYMYAKALRTKQPPKGFEAIKSINIIRDFEDDALSEKKIDLTTK